MRAARGRGGEGGRIWGGGGDSVIEWDTHGQRYFFNITILPGKLSDYNITLA